MIVFLYETVSVVNEKFPRLKENFSDIEKFIRVCDYNTRHYSIDV